MYTFIQEMKLNTCYAKSVGQLAEILIKLSATLSLPSYRCTYLRDFPSMTSLDLSSWSSIVIPDKIQPPVWFPAVSHTLTYTLTCILRRGTYTPSVYYLPGITERLEALIKVRYRNKAEINLELEDIW